MQVGESRMEGMEVQAADAGPVGQSVFEDVKAVVLVYMTDHMEAAC